MILKGLLANKKFDKVLRPRLQMELKFLDGHSGLIIR